ncbi:MAG: ribonuclease HII [Gemmatimonadaceae bacterium]
MEHVRARRARRTWPLIAGIDEVGRGPLAGPVVACAVIMPPDSRAINGVDDSKALGAAERARLAVKIRERAICFGLGAASVREIDRVNIYHATVLAMRRALGRLREPPDHVLVDGREIRTLAVPHTAIVGGDRRCYSIACASILAKVTRDRLMSALARRYPDYRWETNVGYGTPEHWTRVHEHGLSPHHRRTFVKSRQLALDFDAELGADFPVELSADVVADALSPIPAIVPSAPDDVASDLPYFPDAR